MAETLLFVGIGTLLIVGSATLVIAAFILRNARRSVELAEGRMKYLREEQARLEFLREERESLKEELKQEREQHLEAERRAERLRQEGLLLRQDQRQLVEELEQEHERCLDAQQRAERIGQERLLLQQEHNHLKEELKREREERLAAQRRGERLSQERLLLQQEHNHLKEELKREREERLELQRQAERLGQERLLLRQDQGRLADELEQERAKHLDAQQRAWQEHEGREREREQRRDVERRADHLKREVQELRDVRQESSPPVLGGVSEDLLKSCELLGETSFPAQRAQAAEGTRQPASSVESRIPETTSSKPTGGPPEDGRPRLGVRYPHPDDGVNQGKASAEQANAQSGAPVKMDHKHYDKYLENYQGYVELAEKLHRMRDNGEVRPGSPAEHEWEKRLRRVNEGIQRTTAKLDVLEERNPELATDDRVSHRASLARRQSKLEK